jgi:DNA-binding LacI/PurR family transcriptional regulator
MIGQVTGTILYPWDSPECVAAISNIINNGVKVVFVDRTIPGVDASSVAIDHFRGSYQATEHLIQNHKLPVHFFGNISGSSACCLRYTGYSEAMYEYGYHDLSKYVFELSKPEVHIADASRSKTAHIVEKDAEKFIDQCMTADKFCVTTQNDDSALAVYNEALKRGIKIGQQLFLVGFSDRPFCTKLPVPLSSVAQFDDRVGYEAAKLLHKMLQSDFERPVHITIPPELRIRKSSVFG